MFNSFLNEIDDENSFACVSKKVNEFKEKNPNKKIISLGVGDVSKPIAKNVIKAMHEAVDDLSKMDTFKGYGAYYGYDFLKTKILENEYKNFNFSLDEIYISNGTKTDVGNILELFDINSKICVLGPTYPIYKNGALSLSRNVDIINSNEENNFSLKIPDKEYDIIYICSPSNPTGICYSYEELQKLVDYAKNNNSIILYDNVYTEFIISKDVPKSIYEIDNSKNVAIEFRSFSKTASFTGVRCSYYVIPKEIDKDINKLWKKRTINRFNGADYIAQKGAAAIYETKSKKEIQKNLEYYRENTKILKEVFEKKGFKVYGGINSPYLWVKTKNGMHSWDFFDFFLKELNIVIIPGIIFGNDNYFRVSGLASREVIKEAKRRIESFYE